MSPEARFGDGRLRASFWRRVQPSLDGCWIWTGALSYKGYGQSIVRGNSKPTHRFFYKSLVGPIGPGLTCDHLCRVRCCVNPSHIDLVSIGENVLRGVGPTAIHARKTACKRGHPFDAENTRIGPSGRERVCKTCEYERHRVWNESHRVEHAASQRAYLERLHGCR